MKQRNQPSCRICGKALSDPVSVERGIGPECAGKSKRKEHADQTDNLFASRSEYCWGRDGLVIWIKDLEGAKTVTNDIEFVLGDIHAEVGADLFKCLIMYRDSMLIWDGVRLAGRDVYQGIAPGGERQPRVDIDDFFSLHETDYTAAKVKLLGMVNTGKIKSMSPTDFFQ